MNKATAPLFNGAVLYVYNVKYEDDIADPEKRRQGEVNSVKPELSDEQLRLKRVSDLIKEKPAHKLCAIERVSVNWMLLHLFGRL